MKPVHIPIALVGILSVAVLSPSAVLAQMSLLELPSGDSEPTVKGGPASVSGYAGLVPGPQSVGQHPLAPRQPYGHQPIPHRPFPPYRPLPPAPRPFPQPYPPAFAEGSPIMVRWQDGSAYYRGKVVHVRKEWYHVVYEDGDQEAVRADQISKFDPAVAVPSQQGIGASFGPPTRYFKPGQRVRGQWHALRGASPLANYPHRVTFAGTVLEAMGNWYHVLYDDHDQEVTLSQFLTPEGEAPTPNLGFAEPAYGF
jgi:hypothetical protein